MKEHRSGDWSPDLSDDEKRILFAIARNTLAWSLAGKKSSYDFSDYNITEKLQVESGTFVTFKNKGELRGCIGCLVATEPMYLSVHRSAANASTDGRFWMNPITPSEIPEIDIHVSILSPMQEIASVDEFRLGAHGILIEKGRQGAVFLPEVAIEQKWTKEETLASLSAKAGMPPDGWKSGTKYFIFQSVVLTEK